MANIFIYDEFNPEDTAMMQALYSRSPRSVAEHVDKVKQTGSGKFMEKFYVGYGHASIADCGSTTIFIEKISILGDKAIQDWPLYSGQETSTRYIDMSKQPIIDPLNTEASKSIHQKWMDFYVSGREKMQSYLKEQYPKKEEEKESVYEKAIAARSFDIMRAFLPAGITTQLSWHTNLRQAHDKLSYLLRHPLPEVKATAATIHNMLKEKYPSSFSHVIAPEQNSYWTHIMEQHYYLPTSVPKPFCYYTNIKKEALERYQDILDARPPKTGLPHFLSSLGNFVYQFFLDFGSFRDIQRHRNGVCRMPLLTTNYGFNSWYLEQLPADLRTEAQNLIAQQTEAINNLEAEPLFKQYYIAMGFNVVCLNSYSLPAAVYLLELRSGQAVHPTLRRIAHRMYKAVSGEFPFLKLHADLNADAWDVNRGLHDIITK